MDRNSAKIENAASNAEVETHRSGRKKVHKRHSVTSFADKKRQSATSLAEKRSVRSRVSIHANGSEVFKEEDPGEDYTHHDINSEGSVTSHTSHRELASLHGLPGIPGGKKVNITIKRNHHTKRTHKVGHHGLSHHGSQHESHHESHHGSHHGGHHGSHDGRHKDGASLGSRGKHSQSRSQ